MANVLNEEKIVGPSGTAFTLYSNKIPIGLCAEAVDGTDAVDKAQQFRPDVMVLDFFMPGMTGVEAAGVLRNILPSVPILIVTLYITAQLIAQAKSVGIRGAVSKSDIRQIVFGVEALANQRTFFNESG